MSIIEIWRDSPAFYLSSIFILGLMVGSFLNVVIHRLPKMMKSRWRQECEVFLSEEDGKPLLDAQTERYNLLTPRSHCPACGHKISALENIPIISYLVLGGRCKACKTPIAKRYPLIELVSALLVLATAWQFGVSGQASAAIILTWVLLTLTMIDYDHQYLPDDLTLPFLWLGLILNLYDVFTDIQSALIGAMVGYMLLWTVYQAFKLFTGKEGMGFGDFKLLAMLGAWLGWQALPAIIILSSLVGAVVGILLIIFRQHDKQKPIPFGPYLAAAGWIALIWGSDITRAYLNFSGL